MFSTDEYGGRRPVIHTAPEEWALADARCLPGISAERIHHRVPTVRPKRAIHAFGIGSVLVMVPVAVESRRRVARRLWRPA